MVHIDWYGRRQEKEKGPASLDQMLKVSMSLAAQTRGGSLVPVIHPACAMLQPKLPTRMTASSSSSSSGFEMDNRPSDDADSNVGAHELPLR
jgi:hypothetical protein